VAALVERFQPADSLVISPPPNFSGLEDVATTGRSLLSAQLEDKDAVLIDTGVTVNEECPVVNPVPFDKPPLEDR